MTKKNLYQEIDDFLKRYIPKHSKLLLAYSGGPDSVALLNLLKHRSSSIPFTFELAHVDHGQRQESKQEALEVKEMAKQIGIKLHFKSLEGSCFGNLENHYRIERLKFFSELTQKNNFYAVLLAHHLDDLKETVLKRFLEGAHFENLGGMHSETFLFGIRFLRPLLNIPKEKLLLWLKDQSLTYFKDATNENTAFLRARMRKELFPFIENNFGKKIGKNLQWASKQSKIYHDYLSHQIALKLPVQSGPLGLYVDCRGENIHLIEVQQLIKEIAKKKGITLSREQVEAMGSALIQKSPTKKWIYQGEVFYTYRGFFFYLQINQEVPSFDSINLAVGTFVRGPWTIEVKEVLNEESPQLGWERLFTKRPRFILLLPEKKNLRLRFSVPFPNKFYFNKKISKWWEEHKIPPFLRDLVPVIEENESIMCEFLTKKVPYPLPAKKLKLSISCQKALK